MAHDIKSPGNKPYFFQMKIRQYWLVKLSPNKLSDRPEMPSKIHYGILKIFMYFTEFYSD